MEMVFLTHSATVPVDSDGDGISDYLDLDSDDDGIPDTVEAQTTAQLHTTHQYGFRW